MSRSLKGQVVVVTGASSGVGRAVAHAFAAEGCRVALLARNEAALRAAEAEVVERGGEALALVTDVAEAAQVEAAAERVSERWGPPDVWVNDAMVTVLAPAVELRPQELERITRVNYLGAVYGTQAALRRMRPRGRGLVLQIGSALAYRSIPLQSAYCASKAALRAFTDSVRSELLHERSAVRLTMLQLPALNTPQFEVGRNKLPGRMRPVGRIFQPELVGRAAVWAARHEARELWVGGTVAQAIIGQKLFPGLLDRYLARKAWDGQQSAEPNPPGRADNLFQPVPFDPGTHGRFDAEARAHSLELLARTHRGALLGLAALGGALWLIRRKPLGA